MRASPLAFWTGFMHRFGDAKQHGTRLTTPQTLCAELEQFLGRRVRLAVVFAGEQLHAIVRSVLLLITDETGGGVDRRRYDVEQR